MMHVIPGSTFLVLLRWEWHGDIQWQVPEILKSMFVRHGHGQKAIQIFIDMKGVRQC